jgi:hypothetical protein
VHSADGSVPIAAHPGDAFEVNFFPHILTSHAFLLVKLLLYDAVEGHCLLVQWHCLLVVDDCLSDWVPKVRQVSVLLHPDLHLLGSQSG